MLQNKLDQALFIRRELEQDTYYLQASLVAITKSYVLFYRKLLLKPFKRLHKPTFALLTITRRDFEVWRWLLLLHLFVLAQPVFYYLLILKFCIKIANKTKCSPFVESCALLSDSLCSLCVNINNICPNNFIFFYFLNLKQKSPS